MVLSGLMSPASSLPYTASHEGAGTVVALGPSPNTNNTNFKPGDRVMAGLPYQPCTTCPDCTGPETERHYCSNLAGYVGVNRDGAFAEYMLVDARTSVAIPPGVTFQTAAPLACAGSTAFRAVKTAGLGRGEILGIVGAGGGVGHLAVQFAKARGSRVVAIDASEGGIELARSVGADTVIDVRRHNDGKDIESIVRAVRAYTHPTTTGPSNPDPDAGVAATLTLSDSPTASSLACAITKKHGLMIQVAQPESVSIPFNELIFRDIRVRGSLLCSREEGEEMLEIVAKHEIRVEMTVFRGGLERGVPALMERVRGEGGRLVGKGVVVVDEDAV